MGAFVNVSCFLKWFLRDQQSLHGSACSRVSLKLRELLRVAAESGVVLWFSQVPVTTRRGDRPSLFSYLAFGASRINFF